MSIGARNELEFAGHGTEKGQDVDRRGWETYLYPILQLRYEGTLGDESQELALPAERHRHNQGHEDDHLEDEKGEDETVVERHDGQWVVCGLGWV